MAVEKRSIFPGKNLIEDPEKQMPIVETVLDGLLQLQGYASVILNCSRHPEVREKIRVLYTSTGWQVEFIRMGASSYFWVEIQ